MCRIKGFESQKISDFVGVTNVNERKILVIIIIILNLFRRSFSNKVRCNIVVAIFAAV